MYFIVTFHFSLSWHLVVFRNWDIVYCTFCMCNKRYYLDVILSLSRQYKTRSSATAKSIARRSCLVGVL